MKLIKTTIDEYLKEQKMLNEYVTNDIVYLKDIVINNVN